MKKISRRSFLPMFGTALIGASCLSIQDKEKPKITPEQVPLKPPRLKKGDTVAICAPAGDTYNQQDVYDFKKTLEIYGFKVKLGTNALGKHGYFSANDSERAKGFMQLIIDTEVKGIFFTRGGWGCARILDLLDYETIQANPKVILGFSDITSLLIAITHKTGLITFHGPGGNSTWNDFSWQSIQSILIESQTYKFTNHASVNNLKVHSTGTAEGTLYGGNLSVLSGILGSDYVPDWQGKILFLEDVMEEPYRIDRMLTQLKLNGVFDQISGLVLGQFRKCTAEEPHRSFTLDQVFEQHFKEARFPVFSGASFGHVKYKNTLPIGAQISMNADECSFRTLEQVSL